MMNTKTLANTKSNRLYALLKDKIETGVYEAGTQLPSCRRLAEEYSVSYVTASQALKTLVGEGLARNLRGRGVFIPAPEEEEPSERRVTLLCPGLPTPSAAEFMTGGARVLSKAGWTVRPLIAASADEAIAELEDYGSYFIFFGYTFVGYRKIIEAIERLRAQRRVIVLGERCERFGIASIVADEPQLVRLCMRKLQAAGLKRIGLLCGNVGNSVEQERLAAWRHFYSDEEWQELFFDMKITCEDGDEGVFAERYFAELQQEGAFKKLDALICPDPKLAAVAVGCLQDHGFRIPEDIALVSIGDADYLSYLRPRIAVVEPGFEDHLESARALLEERVRGLNTLPLLHLCEPHWIPRDSVKALK